MENVFGKPPDWFDEEKQQIWREIIAAAPPGLLQPCDHWAIELTVTLVVRCRSPHVMRGDLKELESMLGKLGMQPRSRARITANSRRVAKSRPN